MSFLYEPFYVGKGHGNRVFSDKNAHATSVMRKLGIPSNYSVVLRHEGLEECLSEDFALYTERCLIALIR